RGEPRRLLGARLVLIVAGGAAGLEAVLIQGLAELSAVERLVALLQGARLAGLRLSLGPQPFNSDSRRQLQRQDAWPGGAEREQVVDVERGPGLGLGPQPAP